MTDETPNLENVLVEMRANLEGKTLDEILTPLERVLTSAAPIVAALEMVRREAVAGRPHAAGVYVARQGSILTLSGEPQEAELVALRIALPALIGLSEAFAAARSTPFGVRLSEKILAFGTPAEGKATT